MRKTRIIISLFLIIMFIAITGFTYAYWDNLSSKKTGNEVGIGQGTTVEVFANLANNTDKNLIATDAIQKQNDIYEFAFKYTIKMDNAPLEPYNLDVLLLDKKIGDDASYAELINTEITCTEDISFVDGKFASAFQSDRTSIEVCIKVTLTAPNEKEIYDLIKNKNITFKLIFSAVKK